MMSFGHERGDGRGGGDSQQILGLGEKKVHMEEDRIEKPRPDRQLSQTSRFFVPQGKMFENAGKTMAARSCFKEGLRMHPRFTGILLVCPPHSASHLSP